MREVTGRERCGRLADASVASISEFYDAGKSEIASDMTTANEDPVTVPETVN